jgi:hypothetical protein
VEVALVEPQHRPRAVPVDLLHRDLKFLAVLEPDEREQVAVCVSFDVFDIVDVPFPIFLFWDPGVSCLLGSSSFRGRRFFG